MSETDRVPHLSRNWHPAGDLVVARAHGCELFDEQGKRYLDFMAGIAVVSTGHCHPHVVAAVREQAGRLIHSQSYLGLHRPILRLAAALAPLAPGPIDTFFFCSSGSEAVEAAVRLARSITGRPNVIAFQGAFHGRTAGAMSLTTSNATYRSGALPPMPGVFFAPYPRPFRHGITAAEAARRCLQALRELLQHQTRPEHTSALIVELVQGEGGLIPAPPEFLRGLRALCDEHGMLFIADEIQTGAGRTGRMFACEHTGLQPDIVTVGKGLCSGFPMGIMGTAQALMDQAPNGSQGGTFNGNALACAAGVATLEVMEAEGLPQRAAEQGAYLQRVLRQLQQRHAPGKNAPWGIGDVRGLGLMVGVELTATDRAPATEQARAVVQRCRADGLILIASGPDANVVRWTPPLVVSRAQIDEGAAIFAQALGAVQQQSQHRR